jgi:hypothetical protein
MLLVVLARPPKQPPDGCDNDAVTVDTTAATSIATAATVAAVTHATAAQRRAQAPNVDHARSAGVCDSGDAVQQRCGGVARRHSHDVGEGDLDGSDAEARRGCVNGAALAGSPRTTHDGQAVGIHAATATATLSTTTAATGTTTSTTRAARATTTAAAIDAPHQRTPQSL